MVYKVGFLEKIFGEKFPKVVTEYYEAGYKYYEAAKKAEGTVIGKQSRGIYTKDGLWTYWYKNGQKSSEGTYKGVDWSGNPKSNGLWTDWYKNGQKKEERTYKAGKRDGKSVTYWSKTGKKREEGTYKNGKKDGFWIYRYENGRKKEKRFFNESKKIIRRSKPKKKPRKKNDFVLDREKTEELRELLRDVKPFVFCPRCEMPKPFSNYNFMGPNAPDIPGYCNHCGYRESE